MNPTNHLATTGKEESVRFAGSFETIFQLVQPALLVGLDGSIVEINSEGEKLCGVKKDFLIGKKVYSLVKDLPNDSSRKEFKDIEPGEIIKGVTEITKLNSSKIALEYVLHGQVINGQHLILIRDITKYKQSEQRLIQNSLKFQSLVHNSSDMIAMISSDGKIKYASQATFKVIGFEPEEVLGKSIFEFVYEEDINRFLKAYNSFLEDEIAEVRSELRLISKTKQWVFVEAVITNLEFEGKAYGVAVNIRDIQERKMAERQLLETQGFMHQITNSISNILYVYDLISDRYVYLNQTAEKILGYPSQQLKGYSRFHFSDLVHPDDLPKLRRSRKKLQNLKREGQVETEFRVRNKQGDWIWLSSRDQVSSRNMEGKAWQILGTMENITERKNLEQKMAHDALHDSLTGLPNRSLFTMRLQEFIESVDGSERNFAVLFLDLDRFKIINDSLGHSAGDILLINAAERLKSCLPSSQDVVSRLGGDEFTILLTDISDSKEVIQVVKNIQSKFMVPFELEGRKVSISTSIGIAFGNENYTEPGQILRDADTAMYRAKNSGRSRYAVFDRQMHISIVKMLQLEGDLRRAIVNQELEVYYQPIISASTHQIKSCEALLRWNHPTRGFVPPSEFIHIAEDTGLINDIQKFVLEQACAQNKKWQDMNLQPITISVNLSPIQFKQKNLTNMVEHILIQTGLNPRYLELEITEGIVIDNTEAVIKALNEFKEMGIDLSIDDFGTGFSSLTYLKKLPIDAIKIDQSFVQDINTSSETAAIISTLIQLAHKLNLKVVAEGVETDSQLEFLESEGCDHIQGFLFSPPVQAEKIPALLKTVSDYVFV
ncbi:MAG: hypothetical protein OHK0017_00120 [Patescibacteria group bacterium]